MIRGQFGPCRFGRRYPFGASIQSNNSPANFIVSSSVRRAHFLFDYVSHRFSKLNLNPYVQHFSSFQPGLSWAGSTREILLNKLDSALNGNQIDEAWSIFNDFKSLYGFPQQGLLSKLIIKLCYSSKSDCLTKAYDLVLLIAKEKSDLLHHDFLTRLTLTLARAQMHVPASTVLRLMLEKNKFLPIDILSTVFLHMLKTPIGTYLASDILVEICECYLNCKRTDEGKASKYSKLITPNTTIFNLVLSACLRFGATIKAQQIMEDVMPHVGVVADANTIILMAMIYERNGLRDGLKKLKEHVDGVSITLRSHYQHFYESLLNLHFKFDDISAAAGLVLDLYKCQNSIHSVNRVVTKNMGFKKPCMVQLGSPNLRTGLKMQIEPELMQNDFVIGVRSRAELVIFQDSKFVASNKAIAKLINSYVKERKADELSNLLISIQKEMGFTEASSLSSAAIDACVQLGWLETAHDILDDMELAGIPTRTDTYMSLLRAYCKGNQLREAKVLLKQMRTGGLPINFSDEKFISTFITEDYLIDPFQTKNTTKIKESSIAKFLTQEIRGEESTPALVYEMNSSIYFFCKAKMIEDALKVFRRMQQMKLQPTVQTFSHLVNGYSYLQLYHEITILWGEVKKRMDDGILSADRDLLECLLCNFIRGGYFERVMEIISYMEKHCMHTDKWKYKREFLKHHKDLYRSLKASKARTEAQSKRLEHVRAFRRLVGID